MQVPHAALSDSDEIFKIFPGGGCFQSFHIKCTADEAGDIVHKVERQSAKGL